MVGAGVGFGMKCQKVCEYIGSQEIANFFTYVFGFVPKVADFILCLLFCFEFEELVGDEAAGTGGDL